MKHVLQSTNFEDRELLRTEQDSALLGAKWIRLFGDDGVWENRVYYRNTDKTSSAGEAFPFTDPLIDPWQLSIDEVPVLEDILTLMEGETEIGLRSDVLIGNRWGRFGTGLRVSDLDLDYATALNGEWIRYVYDARDMLADPDDRYIVLNPEDTSSELVQRGNQFAACAEQIFEVNSWDVRVGARYESDSFSGRGYVSPRLSANYWISPSTRVAATAGTFYQLPRFSCPLCGF